jgi:hypothetical protein
MLLELKENFTALLQSEQAWALEDMHQYMMIEELIQEQGML